MEAELMKVVWCLNRSWTHDSYFNLHRTTIQLINRGKVSGLKYPDTKFTTTDS